MKAGLPLLLAVSFLAYIGFSRHSDSRPLDEIELSKQFKKNGLETVASSTTAVQKMDRWHLSTLFNIRESDSRASLSGKELRLRSLSILRDFAKQSGATLKDDYDALPEDFDSENPPLTTLHRFEWPDSEHKTTIVLIDRNAPGSDSTSRPVLQAVIQDQR